MNDEELKDLFSWHKLNENQLASCDKIREAGYLMARVVLLNTPCCADQTAALRKIREATFTANAAISIKG